MEKQIRHVISSMAAFKAMGIQAVALKMYCEDIDILLDHVEEQDKEIHRLKKLVEEK